MQGYRLLGGLAAGHDMENEATRFSGVAIRS